VGGGIGVAPLYPIAKALKQAGNHITTIIGARTKDLIILEKEMAAVSDELVFATDDGSRGVKGFVSDALKNLIQAGRKFDLAAVIGPVPMMRATCNVTREFGIHTIVSLNPIMVDGTGMCGGCRVMVGGQTKFACVDGPEFDGHKVDFDGLVSRLRMYDHLKECASGAFAPAPVVKS
jgi:ferredoxin--NADP+ reductase